MKNKARHLTSLEENISRILKPLFAKKKDNFLVISNLRKNWPKIIGNDYHQFCFPKRIKFPKGKKNNAILTISASNSAIGFYLEATSNQIIENIASYYGYKIISEIRIIQEPKVLEEKKEKIPEKISPEKEKFIANSTAKIQDDALKLILQKLGKSISKTTKL
ncbi:MAG: hypothetical protein ACJAW3_001611 [Lentimonas sp.]|jgi:hypothetical protein